jgi:transcriptional regulator with XRE-family HTH domain
MLDEMFTPEQRKQIDARVRVKTAELLLAELREQTGKSQTEVAKALGVKQPSLSKMERQADMKLSSLSSYAAALGGRLKLVVELPDREPVVIAIPAVTNKPRKAKPTKRTAKPPLRRKSEAR